MSTSSFPCEHVGHAGAGPHFRPRLRNFGFYQGSQMTLLCSRQNCRCTAGFSAPAGSGITWEFKNTRILLDPLPVLLTKSRWIPASVPLESSPAGVAVWPTLKPCPGHILVPSLRLFLSLFLQTPWIIPTFIQG